VTGIDELMAQRSRDVLVSGWPFKQQRPIVPTIPLNDTLGQITEKMTRGFWTWTEAHEAAAAHYEGRGELAKAAREYTTLTREVPLQVDFYLRLAQIYSRLGHTQEMRAVLTASLSIVKTSSAYRGLGDLDLQSRNPLEAITAYQNAIALGQQGMERIQTMYVLALAYLRANMLEPCVAQLNGILAEKPDFSPAQELLATIRRIRESQNQHPPTGAKHR
jgi:tetratricopeptide (TPR) repeat protein